MYGVEAITVTVEVNVNNRGNYYIVGLLQQCYVKEFTLGGGCHKSNHFFMPRTKLVGNLAPADIRQNQGTAFGYPLPLWHIGCYRAN